MVNEVFDYIKLQLSTVEGLKRVEWLFDQETKAGGITITPIVFVSFGQPTVNALTKKHQEVVCELDLILYTDFKKSINKLSAESMHGVLEREIRNKLWKFEEFGGEPMQKQEGLLKSVVRYRYKWVEARPTKPVHSTISGEEIIPQININ